MAGAVAAAIRTAPGARLLRASARGSRGTRGGLWLARAPSSPPIPGACPNFLIQGTCGRSSCALPSSLQSLLYPPGAGAESADATIAAVATTSGTMGLTVEGSGGGKELSTFLS